MADDSYTQNDNSARRTPDTDASSNPELGLVLQSPLPETLGRHLHELYSDNITAKILRASIDCLRNNVSPDILMC